MARKLFLKLKEAKKRVFSFVLKNERIFLFGSIFFVILVLGTLIPVQLAQALAWLPNLIAMAIATLLFGMLVLISILFFDFAEVLMRFVLSPNFINVPYTTNAFVQLGWGITRDLANMFFIIILAIIGLATALRIKEYQWQKILLRLILIALLINFTPVILGLIIDASNIIMNFFIEGISKEVFFVTRLSIFAQSIWSMTQESNFLEILLMPVFFINFNFVAGFIYLAFTAIFMLRYVALWTLVILSPIAFLCSVLPMTQNIWKTWWNQFIQWCIVGVAAAFFVYLGDQLLFLVLTTPGFIREGTQEGWGLLNVLVPYWVIMAFLFFGFFTALSTSAIGAGTIISTVQRGAKAAGKTAGKQTWKKTTDWTREKITGSEKVQQLAQRMAQMKTWGETETGLRGFLKRGVTKDAAGAIRQVGRAIGPERIEKERSLIQEREKEVVGKTAAFQLAALRAASSRAERVGILNAIIKDNNLDDATDAGLQQDKELQDKEIIRIRKEAETYDAHKEIVSARPDLEKARINDIATSRGISPARAYAESIPGEPDSGIISKIRPHRAGYVSRSVLKDDVVMEAIARSWDGRHIGKFIESHGREGVQAIEKAITDPPPNGLGGMSQLQTINPQLHQFIQNTAGRRLGFSII